VQGQGVSDNILIQICWRAKAVWRGAAGDSLQPVFERTMDISGPIQGWLITVFALIGRQMCATSAISRLGLWTQSANEPSPHAIAVA